MIELSQSPTDPGFVQDPYPFYERARQQAGSIFHWREFGMPATPSFAFVSAILRDRRFGRTPPPAVAPPRPDHLAGFHAIEDHSMLELEPPRHTRLRKLVLHAFTSRRIAGLQPRIEALSHQLIDAFPGSGPFDLIPAFAARLPVVIIARLLGVRETDADRLLDWSHRMVAMYQAGRDRRTEDAADQAAREFGAYIREVIDFRRRHPDEDLISELIAAEQGGSRLSPDEMVATCILLLNAGHEATVHTFGNGIKAMLDSGTFGRACAPDQIDTTIEEILRFDTPLHLFTRYAYEDVELGRFVIPANSQVACLLAAANRDPSRWDDAQRFQPDRPVQTHVAFGAGTHFCIGAPLARLELRSALPILARRCAGMHVADAPRFAPSYHFHGLESLRVAL